MAHVGGQRISSDYRDRRPSAPPCTSHAHEVCTERVSQHSCVWLRELCAEENTGEATTHSRCRVYVSGSTQVAFAIASRVGQKLKKTVFARDFASIDYFEKEKLSDRARNAKTREENTTRTQTVHVVCCFPHIKEEVFFSRDEVQVLNRQAHYRRQEQHTHTHDEAWNIFPLVLPPVHNTGVCTHRSSPSKGEGVLLRDVEKPGRIGSHLPGR